MNSGIRRRQWALVVGALATGIVALGLGLELENASAVEKRAESPTLSKVSAPSAAKGTRATDFFGQLPGGGYPTIVTAPVDYRDDEGTRLRAAGLLKGPMPFLFDSAVADMHGTCTFDVQCDDGDPCTTDECDFIPGSPRGSGKCVNVFVDDGTDDGAHGNILCRVGLLCGGCDDDLPCNGVESCQSGVCAPGAAATCCTDPEAEGGTAACTNTLARCNDASLNVGDVCTSDAQCIEDPDQDDPRECVICQPTCTSAVDCDDGKKCNGAEVCDGGVCKAGINPCGAAASCDEGVCSNDAAVDCSEDEDCSGGTCEFAATPTCYEGRCCRTDDLGQGTPDEPGCKKKTLAFCEGKGFFYASDEGLHIVDPDEQKCGNNDPDRSDDPWGCPKYSSGISQLDAASPPQYSPPVGPISDSTQPVNTPRAHYDVGDKLNRLGDNYEFLNGSFMEIEVLRWVGAMAVPNRVLIEIWDDADPPNFVEDLIISPLGTSIKTIVVPFNPPLPIASKGWITLRVANTFTPNAEIVWLPTSSGVTTGINTPDDIWVNDGPTASFLNTGDVLAFEIAGNKIDPPVGACCDADTGTCDGKLSWVCKQTGNSYLGGGTACSTCTPGDNTGANCRTCQGDGANNGSACTDNSECDSGNCDAMTCAASADGAAGDACLRAADCDSGTCAADAGVCTGGVCDNDPEQPCSEGCGLGSCILSTCEPTIRCTSGACCTDGACAETVGASCTTPSTFLGFGTRCDIDDGEDFGDQHCCPQPYDDTNADLPATCVGDGADNGSTCTDGTECESGNCVADLCAPSATGAAGSVCTDRDSCDSRSCVVNDDLYDNDCTDGTCWTGADNCEETITHQITVPGQGDDPVVITITGDNSKASRNEASPDSCLGVADDPDDRLGWYETFEIDDCAMVRLDTCCTEGVFKPSFTFLYTPGESGDPCDCLTAKSRDANPYIFGQASFARGEPYCTLEDNIWFTHGPIPAGKYAFELLSDLSSHLGPYKMHITVAACPDAACCKPDGSCLDNVNQLECEGPLNNGFHLAPPNIASTSAVGLCTGSTCSLGSCCFGPGQCKDFDGNGDRYTEALCTADVGQFFGRIRCGGGFCKDGNGDLTDVSCADGQECLDAGLASCFGDAEQLEQSPVCPVCTINTEATCQRDPGEFSVTARLSDTSHPTRPVRVVDDVLITSTAVLETVCVIGIYVDLTVPRGEADCSVDPEFSDLSEEFTVKLYSTDPELYLPGALLGEWITIISEDESTPAFISPAGIDDDHFWRHELTLIATTENPLIELQQGEIYWVEVANNTVGPEVNCNWFWLGAAEGEGNGIHFQDLCEKYTRDDAEIGDTALCLNVEFEAPEAPIRACCTGDPENPCVPATFGECDEIDGDWQFGQGGGAPCEDFVCPVQTNDACEDALFVEEGSFTFDLSTATDDGPAMHDCSSYNSLNGQVEIEADLEIGHDIWYFYTPTATGSAYVSACNCERGGDEVIAIYHDPANPSVCPCPADDGFSFLECWDGGQQNACNPNGCTTFGDHPEVVMDVVLGNCYTIRVGSDNETHPRGDLRIALGGTCCGDGTRQVEGGEDCDGDDDTLCPGQCDFNCLCPPPVCGDGLAAVDLGEECDGAIDTVCTDRNTVCNTAICECVPKCGNNVKEPGEQCDGDDDALCPSSCIPPGALEECRCDATCGNEIVEVGEACDGTNDAQCPGRCESNCTCPPTECGNDVRDGKLEECDGVDDARCPGQCRLPDDPAGECTCQCAVTVEPPPAPETPPANDNDNVDVSKGDDKPKNRFITIMIPQAAVAVAEVHTTAIEVVLVTLNRRCQQGLFNQFQPCSEDADCPGGVCDKPFSTTRCQGGDNDSDSCVNDGDCPNDGTCTRTGREGSVRYVNIYKVCDGTQTGCLIRDDCTFCKDTTTRCLGVADCKVCNSTSTGCQSDEDCEEDVPCVDTVCDGTSKGCQSSDDCDEDVSCVNVSCVGDCIASLMCPDDVPLHKQPDFPCAVLGCEPDFRDWAGELANRRCEGGPNDHAGCATDDDCTEDMDVGTCTRSAPLHIFGEGIVPARSAYDVKLIPFGCDGDVASCAFKSPSLRLVTARWGDLDANGVTQAPDIALASNKLKEAAPPGSLTKPRVMLVGSLLQPYRNVNVLELQNVIDAVASVPQTGLIKGPQSCPSD